MPVRASYLHPLVDQAINRHAQLYGKHHQSTAHLSLWMLLAANVGNRRYFLRAERQRSASRRG